MPLNVRLGLRQRPRDLPNQRRIHRTSARRRRASRTSPADRHTTLTARPSHTAPAARRGRDRASSAQRVRETRAAHPRVRRNRQHSGRMRRVRLGGRRATMSGTAESRTVRIAQGLSPDTLCTGAAVPGSLICTNPRLGSKMEAFPAGTSARLRVPSTGRQMSSAIEIHPASAAHRLKMARLQAVLARLGRHPQANRRLDAEIEAVPTASAKVPAV